MKKLGELLRTEREKKNLSLHEIGLQLKISAKILQAMENGDESKLPAKTFLRGFVRSYAQYLKIDVAQAMNLFQEEMGSTHPDLLRSPESDTPPSSISEASSEAQSEAKIQTQSISSTTAKVEALQDPHPPAPRSAQVSGSAQKSGKRNLEKAPKEKNTWDVVDESMSSNKMMLTAALVILVGLILFVSKLIEKYKREQSVTPSEVAQMTNSSPSADPSATLPSADPRPIESSSTPTENSSGAASDPLNSNSIGASAPPINPVPSSVTSPASATAPSSAPEVPANPQITGQTKKSDVTAASPNASMVAKSGTLSEAKPEAKPLVKNENSTKPENASTATANTKPVNVETSGTTVPSKPEPGSMNEVIIEATSPISISYDLGNGQIRKVELKATQFHTFRSRQFIDLKISDGGAAQIIFNGRLRGAAGPKGQAVELKYPRP